MTIGFTEKSRTISEFQRYYELEDFHIGLESERISERPYTVTLQIYDSNNVHIAAIEERNISMFDALFGERLVAGDPLQEIVQLPAGEDSIAVIIFIVDDLIAEGEECFSISINNIEDDFRCNDGQDATNYFCTQTICIYDDDGMLARASYNYIICVSIVYCSQKR